MAADGAQIQQDATVQAALNYMIETGDKPVTDLAEPGERQSLRTGRFEAHTVTIHDARQISDRFSLEENGFAIVGHETSMTNFYDEEEIKSIYYPETEKLLLEQAGAARVHVFDHTLRANAEHLQTERQVREPVRTVHNDYTDSSAPQRVRDLLPDEAEALIQRRFGIMQLWRPIGAPVEKTPLAICDAKTISEGDARLTELRYVDRVGEVLQFVYNPDHVWYYMPEMTRDEAFVFKVWDSERDGRARFTGHSAFDHPNPRPAAPERESIEMRALVFW
jgi:hypothetical protein